MRITRKDIEFRISRRTLWIDDHAYPLAGVTRLRRDELKPNRSRMLMRYGRQVAACLGLGAMALVLLGCLGQAVPSAVYLVLALLVLGFVLARTVRLARHLSLPRMYVLSIATAGSNHEAVISTDKNLIDDLIHRVVDAIDNPALEYMIKIDNLEITHGDKVFGSKYEGDDVHGSKILNL